MAPWSGITNAIGGAFKNLGDVFGGDENQSFMDRFGHAMSAAYDVGVKAPVSILGTGVHYTAEGFKEFGDLDQRAYTDIISHPLSDLLDMQNKALYSFENGGFSKAWSTITTGHSWIDSWENSAHFSPGQELVLSANNAAASHNLVVKFLGGALLPQTSVESLFGDKSFGTREINPSDTNAVNTLIGGNNWGNRLSSGSIDGLLRGFLDPGARVMKPVGGFLKVIKNNPIKATTDINKVMQLPRTQRLVNWTVGKDAATIAEHPAFRNNAFRYSIANALSGAKTPAEANLLLRTLFGDRDAWNQLQQVNDGLAFRQANLLAPPEAMEKFALAPGTPSVLDDWLQPVEKSKAAAARAQLTAQQNTLTRILGDRSGGLAAAAGTVLDKTNSSPAAEAVAAARARFKYATPKFVDNSGFLHPSRWVATIQDHAYNVPIRVYHALTDKPAMGYINHAEDSATDQVRSWLNKSKVLTADEKKSYAAQYAQYTKGQRAAGWTNIENAVYNKIAEKYGIAPEQMKQVLSETHARGELYANGAKSGAYGTLSTPDGNSLNLLPTGDSELVAHPDLITQLQAGANPMSNIQDVERAIDQMDKNGFLQAVRGKGAAGTQFLLDQLDRVYGIWKPLSLLTMHRAYNHVGDDLLRVAAKLGGMTVVNNAVEGTGNFMRNRLSRFTTNSYVRNMEGQWEQQVNTARSQFHGLLAQAKQQRAFSTYGIKVPEANQVTSADVRAAANRYQYLRDNKPDFIQPKHRLGTGESYVPGTSLRVEEAFGGPNADYWRQLTSSEQYFQSYVNDAAHNLYQIGRANMANGFDVINPSERPGPWLKAYLHYVNNQLRPDPVANALLKGKNPDLVEKWLSSTSAGRAHMRDLHRADTYAQVQAVQDHIDKYLPTQDMRDLALQRGIQKRDVEKVWPTASQRPEVNGNLNLLVHGGHPATQILKTVAQQAIKFTGSVPDDILVRHPAFNSMYLARRDAMIGQAYQQARTAGQELTSGEISRLAESAKNQARKDLQGLVYDVSRFNDAGHMLRFISPFFNAWYNALTSWSKLFLENPDLLGTASIAKDAIWNNPLMVDTTTGEKANDDTPLANLTLVAHLPEPVAKMLGSGDLSYLPINASTIISPTYADSIGNPGFGPLVTVPVNEMAKRFPSVAEDPFIQQILGQRITANSLQSAIPSGVTQVGGFLGLAGITGTPAQAEDSLNRAKLAWSIYQWQQYEYQEGQRKNPPNWNDIEKQAQIAAGIDTILNRLMPLGFKPTGPGQFYVDQYHNMLDQANGDSKQAQQDFVKKYGEQSYAFMTSLDKVVADAPPTAGGVKAYKQYEGLISKNPDIAPVVIGIQGTGNYDAMAYQWEQANGLRTYRTPQEAATAANVGQGWYDYETMMAKINIVLQQRGLKSINQAGAKDLKAFRTQYENATNDPTSPYYNPDWYAAFGSYNKNAYQQRIQALESVAANPALINNPMRSDIRSLNAYFQYRDQARQYLSDRQNKSLAAAANADVKNWFDYQIAGLIQNDTKFQNVYDRYLKNDDLVFQ